MKVTIELSKEAVELYQLLANSNGVALKTYIENIMQTSAIKMIKRGKDAIHTKEG